MQAEGWYQDPFGIHEARWISADVPTALVRDGRAEAHDEPPSDHFDGPLQPLIAPQAGNADDLLRADNEPAEFDNAGDGVFDPFAGGSVD